MEIISISPLLISFSMSTGDLIPPTRINGQSIFSLMLVSAKSKPMGLSTIGAALSEDEGTIEDVLEPYLIANGYIERTARGRIATQKSYEHFKLGGLKDGLLDDK